LRGRGRRRDELRLESIARSLVFYLALREWASRKHRHAIGGL
jgi:hypothetical protein